MTHGSNFEDLAIKESSGRNALKGGDLGKRKANELPLLFIDAVKDLKPGETSKPVKSASGFHLLQLVGSSSDSVMIEQTHARHILIRTSSEVSEQQARETLLDLKKQIEEILDHKYKGLRVRYWRQEKKSAWILNETGKEKLTSPKPSPKRLADSSSRFRIPSDGSVWYEKGGRLNEIEKG